jgi:hypothetical protein
MPISLSPATFFTDQDPSREEQDGIDQCYPLPRLRDLCGSLVLLTGLFLMLRKDGYTDQLLRMRTRIDLPFATSVLHAGRVGASRGDLDCLASSRARLAGQV